MARRREVYAYLAEPAGAREHALPSRDVVLPSELLVKAAAAAAPDQ